MLTTYKRITEGNAKQFTNRVKVTTPNNEVKTFRNLSYAGLKLFNNKSKIWNLMRIRRNSKLELVYYREWNDYKFELIRKKNGRR